MSMFPLIEESEQAYRLNDQSSLFLRLFGRDFKRRVSYVGPAPRQGPPPVIHLLLDEQDLFCASEQHGPDIDLRRLISVFRGEGPDDLLERFVRQFSQEPDTDCSDF